MKKVISFCLYGCNATYIIGMKENIKLAKEYFSDWEFRIYHNNSVPEKYINEYKELNAICILCENIGENKLNWEGMFWRWLPLDDENVDIWISRDADSRLSAREAKIVDEWINSGKTLHTIRDHRCHFNYIMGGLFGINNKLFHEKYKFKTVRQIIKELSVYYKERPYNVDQIFLNDNLWKILKDDVTAHISKDGRRVYPTDILIPSVPDFMGKQYRLNDDLIIEKANVKSVNPEINIIFKIKSKYKELYLDVIDDKIKLNIFTQEESQLWKLDENNRLISLLNNKFIDTDNKRDLILSDNKKNTWQFQQGGFIINQQNNMAIDFKGGINDKRKEVWLFKLNGSEAQQWDFVELDNNEMKADEELTTDTKDKKIDKYFDQIYIIHLNNLIDRKESIINQIKKFNLSNITIIDAINKNNLDIEKLKKDEIIAYPGNNYCKTQIINDRGDKCWCNGGGHDEHKYPGRIACSLSHYMCYKDIVNKNYKKCLILEDDFIFNNDLHKLFESLYNDIPPDWELIYFQNSRYINYKREQLDYNKNFVSIKYGVADSGCYSVNNYAASVLRDNFLPIRAGSDGYIGVCIDRIFKIKKAYIYKGNLSSNGSVSLFKSVNDNSSINNSLNNDKSLNLELSKLVTSYNKIDINSIYEIKKKNILVLNHNYHHKNKKGLEMICQYLNYNLIYGSENDIPNADVIYCPSLPFNASKYSNKRFVFGPHLSIFPDNKLRSIENKNNSVYIQPSSWARDVWTNWKDMDAEKLIPIKSFPFPVEVDLFKPDEHQIKENVLVMFKYRKNIELNFIETQLKCKNESYRIFRYGSYKEEDYVKYLETCKYGIWIGTHESQGFGLQEALSCNVPLLVWSVTNMNQQENWRGAPDVKATTIGYWSKTCGEYFYKEDEFEKTFQIFLQNLNNYKPREFILNTVSVKQCADNFERVFLNKKTNKKEYKLLTCANENYFNALKQFINNVKEVNIDFDKLIVYDIGLTSNQENELYILQAEYRFYIYKLDFSKYPEHVNLNLEKWSGLNNSYAFKPIIIHKALQNINVPLIYLDCGCGFTNDTINGILSNLSKNHFYISIANNKNTIESLELNHKTTLDYFDIKNTEIITYSANFIGIDYNNDATKKIINEWYNYSMKQEIISPIGSNRNNHRQDQSVLSCILNNSKYNYSSNINVPFLPWKNRGSNTYYNKYKPFSCVEKTTNKSESRIYTNSLDEAIECYQNRKNISREQLLKDFIIQ